MNTIRILNDHGFWKRYADPDLWVSDADFQELPYNEKLALMLEAIEPAKSMAQAMQEERHEELTALVGMFPNNVNDSYQGRPLIEIALKGGDTTAGLTLLDGKFDVAQVTDGRTPLHASISAGNPVLFDRLLALGAPVNTTGTHVQPLHLAAEQQAASFVKALLDKGADPNAVNFEGTTPLHLAAMKGNSDHCFYLVEAGADPNQTDRFYRTPNSLAHGNERVLNQLRAPAVMARMKHLEEENMRLKSQRDKLLAALSPQHQNNPQPNRSIR